MSRRAGLVLACALAAGCTGEAPPEGVAAAATTAGSTAAADPTAPTTCDPEGFAAAPERPDGLIARLFGGEGTAPDRFSYPRAIAAGPGGALAVVDKLGFLRRLDAARRPTALVRMPVIERGTPTGVAFDADGRAFVADSHQQRVLVYDRQLRLTAQWGGFGRDDGELLLVTGIDVAPDGRVWVTDHGDDVARVQVFEPDGAFVRRIGRWGMLPGELRNPVALAVDAANERVAVADSFNHRVQVFPTEGGEPLAVIGALGEAPGELKFPYDVAWAPDGRLVVAEFGNARVSVFEPDGTYVAAFGRPGRAEGELDKPWGICFTGPDRLAVLDSGNNRIYELRYSALLAAAR